MNTYLSVHEYLREASGQETTSLIGSLMRVGTGGVAQGATSLPISIPAPNLQQYDQLYIFDGSSSEIVTVTSQTNGVTTVPISATQYAHAQGVSCCNDGRLGSLGELLIEGAAAVERITRQPLLQSVYTDTLSLLSMRAAVDNCSRLILRPMCFPITAISSIQIQYSPSSIITLDATQAQISNGGKLVKVSVIKAVGSSNNYQLFQYLDPTAGGEVVVTYTAGYTYANLPYIIKRCAAWLTSDLMSDRANPDGAAETSQGDQQIVAYLRGDFSGESALVKRARKNLAPYTQEAW